MRRCSLPLPPWIVVARSLRLGRRKSRLRPVLPAMLTGQIHCKTLTLERALSIPPFSVAHPASLFLHPAVPQQPARIPLKLTFTITSPSTATYALAGILRSAPAGAYLPQPDRSHSRRTPRCARARAPLGPDPGLDLWLRPDGAGRRQRVGGHDAAVVERFVLPETQL